MADLQLDSMGTVLSIHTMTELTRELIDSVRDRLEVIESTFSTYRDDSIISRMNRGERVEENDLADEIASLSESYRILTQGNFNIIRPDGLADPSGMVKAYAINEVGRFLEASVAENWTINFGGDILTAQNDLSVGVVDPLDRSQLLSDIELTKPFCAIATSGVSERGYHIWTREGFGQSDLLQVTVVGHDIIYADVMATAIYAAGSQGISFLDSQRACALLVLQTGELLATEGYRGLVPS
jgi:thiamine biosynthesis lipoprotein